MQSHQPRSKNAARALGELGYISVRVDGGGKTDWADAGLPFQGTRAQTLTGERQ